MEGTILQFNQPIKEWKTNIVKHYIIRIFSLLFSTLLYAQGAATAVPLKMF